MKPFARLAKDTVLYGFGDLAGKLISFVSLPVIAAALRPEDFGALELVLTGVALGGLMVGCGLNNSVQRFYWDDASSPDTRPLVVTTGLGLQLLLGSAAILILCLAAPTLLTSLKGIGVVLGGAAVIAASVLLPAQQWLQYILDVTRLQFAPSRFLTLSLLSRCLVAALSVWAVVVLHAGVSGVLISQAAVTVGLLPLGFWFIRKDLVVRLDANWARELIHFGYPFIFVGGAYWLFGAIDRWMLAAMSSIEDVGRYSVAWRFAAIVTFAAMAFGQAWSPYAIKVRSDYPLEYRRIYASVLTLLLFGMLLVGGAVSLFAGELLALVMPFEYIESSTPLAILSFAAVAQATQQVTAVGLSLEKKTRLLAILVAVAALLNFLLNLVLIPKLGAVGAAWGTAISYFALSGGYMHFTQRLHRLPIQWVPLMLLSTLGALVLTISLLLVQTSIHWHVIAAKVCVSIVCIAIGWRVLPFSYLKSV